MEAVWFSGYVDNSSRRSCLAVCRDKWEQGGGNVHILHRRSRGRICSPGGGPFVVWTVAMITANCYFLDLDRKRWMNQIRGWVGWNCKPADKKTERSRYTPAVFDNQRGLHNTWTVRCLNKRCWVIGELNFGKIWKKVHITSSERASTVQVYMWCTR